MRLHAKGFTPLGFTTSALSKMTAFRTHKTSVTTRQTKKAVLAVTAALQLINTHLTVATGALAKEFQPNGTTDLCR
jgi:hypothetical protein